MKIFWPVEKMSTEALLKLLEDMSGVSFGIGFFLGIAGLVLVRFAPSNTNQEVIGGLTLAALLAIFLVLQIHLRRKIVPELKKRIQL